MGFRRVGELLMDVRVAISVSTIWVLGSFCFFSAIGFLKSHFFHFGPSDVCQFAGIPIDTWPKWVGLLFYCFIWQAVCAYANATIYPWMLSHVQNTTVFTLPFPKWACQLVVNGYWLFGWLSGLLSVFLVLTQFDFMLIHLAAQLVVSTITTANYMHPKRYKKSPGGAAQAPHTTITATAQVAPDTTGDLEWRVPMEALAGCIAKGDGDVEIRLVVPAALLRGAAAASSPVLPTRDTTPLLHDSSA
ncbi:hypothetical protein PAPYR_2592 [Paratrimastix pyriformis]|uniref:Uncharacterized protein n=1 Tax=Paratrimastix pyriformis TaxID=342808 RepID=A0ABQ8UUT6_9EUKA|nr:hypothetical protein PAPYR_2592 [Paratrimastix pyriformis]